jgi:hypothetical protein
MILFPAHFKKKEKERRKILDAQITGWIYESHFWVNDKNEKDSNYKVCRWCGQKSNKFGTTYTSTADPDKPLPVVVESTVTELCTHNPMIITLLRRF